MRKEIIVTMCALLALVCLPEEPAKTNRVVSLRETVEFYASGPHGTTSGEAVSAIKKCIQSCNLKQEEAISEMSSMAREYKRLSEDTSEKVTERMRQIGRVRLSAVIGFLGRLEDRSALPLFEEMTSASNGNTHVYAVEAYIRVAGVDSVPFIKRMLDDERLNSVDHGRIYEVFGRQLEAAKQKGNISIEPCQRFLLEETKKEHTGDGGKQLDKLLNRVLPDYTNSLQRIEAAEWFIKNGSSYHKNYFGNIKTEIEKTPKAKRKDFKAKGELLDPDKDK